KGLYGYGCARPSEAVHQLVSEHRVVEIEFACAVPPMNLEPIPLEANNAHEGTHATDAMNKVDQIWWEHARATGRTYSDERQRDVPQVRISDFEAMTPELRVIIVGVGIVHSLRMDLEHVLRRGKQKPIG